VSLQSAYNIVLFEIHSRGANDVHVVAHLDLIFLAAQVVENRCQLLGLPDASKVYFEDGVVAHLLFLLFSNIRGHN